MIWCFFLRERGPDNRSPLRQLDDTVSYAWHIAVVVLVVLVLAGLVDALSLV